MYDYICSRLIAERVRQRLGQTLAERTLDFVQARRDDYESISNATRLIHCDYNPKNIIVRHRDSAWKVIGILDWEFAAAGSPLTDIGNFLRFEDEFPPGFSESFIRGYSMNSTGLPGDWRETARLLDLAAMANFLDRDGDAPKTFRTAVRVIEKTLSAAL